MVIMNTRTEEYLLSKIRGIYKSFDLGHNEKHFDEVFYGMKRILENEETPEYVREKSDVLLIAAAYHDTGLLIERENHEKFSVIIFRNDHEFRQICQMSDDDRELVEKIIGEHRSRYSDTTGFSNYLKDADKVSGLNILRSTERVVGFNIMKWVDTNKTLTAVEYDSLVEKCMSVIETRAEFRGFRTNAANKAFEKEINEFVSIRDDKNAYESVVKSWINSMIKHS